MKQWTVYFRDKNGSKASVVIESEDRSGVFAELKKRGISAISVTEGASNKKPRKVASSGAASKGRGLIAAAVVVLVGGVAAFFVLNKPKPAEKIITNRSNVVSSGATNVTSGVAKKRTFENKGKVAKTEKEKYDVYYCATNASGVIVEKYRTPDGKTHRRVINPPPIFSNLSDQVIAMVVGSKGGQRIPPLPPMRPGQLDEAFVASLLTPVHVKVDDKPEVAALKLAVLSIKQEIKEAIKNGDNRGVAQILQDHVSQVNQNVELRGEAIQQYQKFLKEGDQEVAAEYLDKVNKKLRSFGIDPISKRIKQERN